MMICGARESVVGERAFIVILLIHIHLQLPRLSPYVLCVIFARSEKL